MSVFADAGVAKPGQRRRIQGPVSKEFACSNHVPCTRIFEGLPGNFLKKFPCTPVLNKKKSVRRHFGGATYAGFSYPTVSAMAADFAVIRLLSGTGCAPDGNVAPVPKASDICRVKDG